MFVLSKIFGDYPQVRILEVFADNFDGNLSVPDIIWLTDISETTVCECIDKLLDEKILLKGDKIGNNQLYRINEQKSEAQIVITLVNYMVSEKLTERLKERGLEPIQN